MTTTKLWGKEVDADFEGAEGSTRAGRVVLENRP